MSEELRKAPPELKRQVFEAFDRQITYDKIEGRVEIAGVPDSFLATTHESSRDHA